VIPSTTDNLLVARLLQLPACERAAYLERACMEDTGVRDRRQSIEEAVQALDSTSGRPASNSISGERALSALQSALDARTSETPGTWIDRYKLLQEIGEGGFGVVWMAEQHEPIRRRVALKIIKSGMDTREVIARFEAERQALALMDHPNIAHVHDAGATDAGRPYFVMELVRGVPITRYCDDNRLTAGARLRLFISVCQAVQHAHHKGVIHRDLKPSNILITMHDGTPVPKIIDFGIAKATGAQLTEKTLFTQFHSFIGTPAYTSPEQMEMSGLDVDTRGDIYSLGVLLYELLTGRPPFDPETLAKSGLDAMRRTIREVDPPRPSARLATLPDAERTTVASRRSTDSGRLSLLMRGDLDWIVMRCLEKDRTRRYETANGLAVDVLRHLANEPVAARPPSGTYRLKKFIRRHKLGVAAVAAVAVSLLAGLVASSVLLVSERAAHTRAVISERAEAELRRQADVARENETVRAAQTARDLAGQLLTQGRTSEGLAWLVHAARKNPRDSTIASRLASVLASRRFLVPEAAPLELGSRIHATFFTPDGSHIFVLCEDGTMEGINATTGHALRDKLPSPPRTQGIIAFHQGLVGLLCLDGVLRVIDQSTVQIVREIRFEKRAVVALENSSGFPGWSNLASPVEMRPGPIMVVILEDQSVAIADITTARTSTIPPKEPLRNFFETSDGRWLFTGRRFSRELEIWDATRGEILRTHSFDGIILWAAISPDGQRLATLTVAGEASHAPVALQVWSIPDVLPITEATVVEQMTYTGVSRVRFSPDGRWLLAEWPEGKRVFDAATGKEAGAFIAAGGGSAFSRDSRRVVVGLPGGIQVLDLPTGNPVSQIMPHGGGNVRTCEFSENGRVLLTTSPDGFARLWDADSGQPLTEPALQQAASPLASISPDGTHVIIGTIEGRVHRLRVGGPVARPLRLPRNGAGTAPAVFLPGSPARLLWFHRDRAKVFDPTSGRELAGGFAYPQRVLGAGAGQRGLGLRSDLRAMVVQTEAGQWQSWEIAAEGITRVVPLEDAPAGVGWTQFSPAGDLVAIVANDSPQHVRFWDLRTGKVVGVPCSHDSPIFTNNARPGAFSPDGRRFAAGSADGVVKVWDVATGATALNLKPLRDSHVRFVNFSSDGTRIVTSNDFGEVHLWDAVTGKPVGAILNHGAPISAADFSQDGRLLLTGSASGVVRVWHADDGSPAGARILHEPSVRSAQFDADAARLVTASGGTTAFAWDVQTGQPLVEPMHHPARLFSATFSPDGQFVRTETVNTATAYSTFWIWSVPPAQPPGTSAPAWLLDLATICATKIIDDTGQCVDAPGEVARFDSMRRMIAALPDDAPYASWGKWLLDDRPDRSIAPGFTITPREATILETTLARASP
jgi:serine/threonine protein kinase/WD40 repeat protein